MFQSINFIKRVEEKKNEIKIEIKKDEKNKKELDCDIKKEELFKLLCILYT